MRYLLTLLTTLLTLAAQAGPPQLFLDVARFRNLNKVEKGAEVEIYVTVPTQSLTYRQRAPRAFQSAAVVTLDILKADGKSVYHEVVTLKPPVLTDTTIAIKNPQSFLKRIMLPDGKYTLRGTVKDQYGSDNAETTVEKPLVLEAPAGPFLSDIMLLARPGRARRRPITSAGAATASPARPAAATAGARRTFSSTPSCTTRRLGQPLRVHYHLTTPDGSAADADADPHAAERPPHHHCGPAAAGAAARRPVHAVCGSVWRPGQ